MWASTGGRGGFRGVAMALSRRAEGLPAKYGWLAGGLAFAVLLHGVYDIWLSLDSLWLNRIAYLHVLVSGAFVLWLMRLRLPPLPDTPRSPLP